MKHQVHICLVLKFQLDILKHSRDMAILLFNTLQTSFYTTYDVLSFLSD